MRTTNSSLLLVGLLSLISLVTLTHLTTCVLATTSNDGSVEVTGSSSAPGLYTLEGQIRLPKSGHKFVNARVLLNGGETIGLVRGDGSFQIQNVLAGRSYTLDVSMSEYQFPPIRVDISNKVGQKGKIKASHAITKQKLPYPLQLKPLVKTEYFQKRDPVNILGMLKNPMVIMMLITVVMVVVMVRQQNWTTQTRSKAQRHGFGAQPPSKLNIDHDLTSMSNRSVLLMIF